MVPLLVTKVKAEEYLIGGSEKGKPSGFMAKGSSQRLFLEINNPGGVEGLQ